MKTIEVRDKGFGLIAQILQKPTNKRSGGISALHRSSDRNRTAHGTDLLGSEHFLGY